MKNFFFLNCAIVVVTRWLLGVPGLWWWCLGRVPDVRVARPGRSRRWQCSVVFTPAVSPWLPYFKTLINFNALSYCFRASCFFGANISTLEMFAAGQVQTFWVHNLLQVNDYALYSFKFTFPLLHLFVIENNRPEGAAYTNPGDRLTEEGCVHMMSLGSKALMMQVWADAHAGSLIFRYWLLSPTSRSCI